MKLLFSCKGGTYAKGGKLETVFYVINENGDKISSFANNNDAYNYIVNNFGTKSFYKIIEEDANINDYEYNISDNSKIDNHNQILKNKLDITTSYAADIIEITNKIILKFNDNIIEHFSSSDRIISNQNAKLLEIKQNIMVLDNFFKK